MILNYTTEIMFLNPQHPPPPQHQHHTHTHTHHTPPRTTTETYAHTNHHPSLPTHRLYVLYFGLHFLSPSHLDTYTIPIVVFSVFTRLILAGICECISCILTWHKPSAVVVRCSVDTLRLQWRGIRESIAKWQLVYFFRPHYSVRCN